MKALAEWYARLWTGTPSDLIRKDVGRQQPWITTTKCT